MHNIYNGVPWWLSGKESTQETHTGDSVNLFLPGESHAQRSLAVCSLCGCKASDTTERLTLSYIVMCICTHI